MEEVHETEQPSQQSKPVAQDHNRSPVSASHYSRKRQTEKVVSGHSKAKTRKSDSAVTLPRAAHSSTSSTSKTNVNVDKQCKASSRRSMPSKLQGTGKAIPLAREEDSIKFLSAERKRLEKENREKKRRLGLLKKQEMLIEAAAKKGGLLVA